MKRHGAASGDVRLRCWRIAGRQSSCPQAPPARVAGHRRGPPGPSHVQSEGLRPDSPINRHFTTGPVAGFLVDDVQAATAQLRSAGVEILFESGLDDSGNAWVHFRAPDGNIYEFTQDPGVSRPH